MYEIKRNKRIVAGTEIETWQREVNGPYNVLSVEAGTNGIYMSNDSGRTYICIKDLFGSLIEKNEELDKEGGNEGIEIEFCGGSELYTVVESLEFVIKVLKEQIEEAKL